MAFDKLTTLWEAACEQSAVSFQMSRIVIVDAHVLALHKSVLEQAFPPKSSRYFEVSPGENSKSTHMWNRIIDFAFSDTLYRTTPLIAIGGGVTGDLAGFAAASLMRGLPLVNIPTTLLAMVDSAIGGKTGINHTFGKNTIGAFYQPKAVLFDTAFLDTLPQREWLCGLSEILKYGYIQDPSLLDDAPQLANGSVRNAGLLRKVIEKSIKIKTAIVSADARETGKRAFLNFGHTFAHALETLDGYRNINHGEAVYAGMIAALYVSRIKGATVSDQLLKNLRTLYNLDIRPYAESADHLVLLMEHDKKNRDRSIQLVLLKDNGSPYIESIQNRQLLIDAWNYTFNVLSNRINQG